MGTFCLTLLWWGARGAGGPHHTAIHTTWQMHCCVASLFCTILLHTYLTFQNWASRSATMQTTVLQSGKLQKSSLLQLVIRKKLLLRQHRYYFMCCFHILFFVSFLCNLLSRREAYKFPVHALSIFALKRSDQHAVSGGSAELTQERQNQHCNL